MAYSFDGPNKLIILSSTSTLDLRDMWSRYTEWLAISDNSKYLPALTTVGGEDIDVSAGTQIPIYIFLQNGWRIRPMEEAHTLSVVNGILVVFGGGDPFVDTLGDYRVGIRYSQPVQAININQPLVAAIKAKTDNLPVDPASSTELTQIKNLVTIGLYCL